MVVVGGGHAGCEAALAAHRMGARTALVTHRFDRIGEMSCNPAIGGLGKGHLVREIDALDGMMGWAADQAGIQFRLLNRSKGPAVQGPRTQVDRALYRAAVQGVFRRRPDLDVIEGEVVDLPVTEGRVIGVTLADGCLLESATVVLTTGTFLRGVIHIGDRQIPAGRHGDPASERLAARMADLGLALGRLKTGTPPRLRRTSIDWDSLPQQAGDPIPEMLSFLSEAPTAAQVSLRDHANKRENSRDRSGQHLPGPRCIAAAFQAVARDTALRSKTRSCVFPTATSHQIFLEPEGLDSDIVYPNGISTSLPADVQLAYVRTIVRP